MSIIIFLLLVGIGVSQVQKCLILKADSICGLDYKGQPVFGSFPTEVEFENSIKLLSNESHMASQYSTEFGCIKKDVRKLIPSIRYRTTFWCAFYVQFAIQNGCNSTNEAIPKGPTICRAQCDLHVLSVKDSISQCTNTTSVDSHLKDLRSVCSGASDLIDQDNPEKYCSTGNDLETKYCGWSSLSIAQKSCKLMKKQDNCCTSIMQLLEKEGIGQEKERWSWWVMLLIGISALAVLIGLYFIIRFFMNKKNNNTSTSDAKNDEDSRMGLYDKNVKSKEGLLFSSKKGFINPLARVKDPKTAKPGQGQEVKAEDLIIAPTKDSIDPLARLKDPKIAKPGKGQEVKPLAKNKGLLNRFRKNDVSLADDLEKAKVKGDQSLNSLMKFFGGAKDFRQGPHLPTISEAFPSSPTSNNPEEQSSPDPDLSSPIESLHTVTIEKEDQKSTETGKTVVVTDTYEAKSSDELSLGIGELIYIKSEFDDGWAVGIEQKTKREGVFPLMCTAKIVTSTSG